MSMASNRKNIERPSTTSELVRLDSVSMDEDDEILPDFEAEVDGRRVWVTAVLERTAGIEPAPGPLKALVCLRAGFWRKPVDVLVSFTAAERRARHFSFFRGNTTAA